MDENQVAETNKSESSHNDSDAWVLPVLLLLLIASIAGFAWALPNDDDLITHIVQSVEYLETETPDVINDPEPSIRITADDGILLLSPGKLDYKIAKNDSFKVVKTRGLVHVQKENGGFINASDYTIHVPESQINELTKQHIDRFGEPIQFINSAKGN